MDYSHAHALLKPQWDLIHNPETTTGLFDGMEEGAYQASDGTLFAKILQEIRCAKFDNITETSIEQVERIKLSFPPNFEHINLGSQFILSNFQLPEIYFERVQSIATVKLANAIIEHGPYAFKEGYNAQTITRTFASRINLGRLVLYSNSINQVWEYINPTATSINTAFGRIRSLVHKDQLTSDDIKAIKRIAACESRFFTPSEKHELISKIFLGNNREYYEDLVLDLMRTTPTGVKSKELYRLIVEDLPLADLLANKMNNVSSYFGIPFGGDENNLDRFYKELMTLYQNGHNNFEQIAQNGHFYYFYDLNSAVGSLSNNCPRNITNVIIRNGK